MYTRKLEQKMIFIQSLSQKNIGEEGKIKISCFGDRCISHVILNRSKIGQNCDLFFTRKLVQKMFFVKSVRQKTTGKKDRQKSRASVIHFTHYSELYLV
jgi:hypothetical protein